MQRTGVIAALAVALAAHVARASPSPDPGAPGLRKLGQVTGVRPLPILVRNYLQANSQLKIGVGPTRAPWRCLVSRKGLFAKAVSLGDEGEL